MGSIYAIGTGLIDIEVMISDDQFRQLATTMDLQKGARLLVSAEQQKRILQTFLPRLPANFDLIALRQALQMGQGNISNGGSSANTMAVYCALGGNGHLAISLADDEYGQFFREQLAAMNVLLNPTDALVNASASNAINIASDIDSRHTGICLVLITADGQRTLLTDLGVAKALTPQHVDWQALAQADGLFLEGYLMAEARLFAIAETAIDHCRAANQKIILSTSDPSITRDHQTQLMQILAKGVNVLFCNQTEARLLSHQDSLDRARAALAAQVELLIITAGSEGAYLNHGDHDIHIPSAAITALNTNGAGDSFAGAFLYAWQHGQALDQCLHFANEIGGLCVKLAGPHPGKRQLQTLKNRQSWSQ